MKPGPRVSHALALKRLHDRHKSLKMQDYSKLAVDLLSEYGMTASDAGRIQLSTLPTSMWKNSKDASGNDVPATKFPKMYERYHLVGWSDAQIGKMTMGWAAWEDRVWGTSVIPFTQPNGTPNLCASYCHINVGPCSLAVTWPLTRAFGIYTFYNSHAADSGGTEIDIWQEQFVDDPTCVLVIQKLGSQVNKIRAGIRSTTFGGEGTVQAYNEITQLSNLHFRGNTGGYYTPGILTVGSLGWDLGSNSADGFLYGADIDIAVMYVRGTPMNTTGPITAMNGNVAAVCLVGCALNTFAFNAGIEVDDFPTAVISIPGFGREAGGRGNIMVRKIESGVTGEKRGPWKGTIVADLQGQFAFDFGVVGYTASGVHTDSLFVLDPRLQNGDVQKSYLKAVVIGSGYENLIQDNLNKKLTPSAGDYAGTEIVWDESGVVRSNRTLPIPVACPNPARLGFQRWNGTAFVPPFDHVNGTPAYPYTGTVTPPTCTWILGAPVVGQCIGGSQTTTTPYVPSVVGCTPSASKPPDLVTTAPCGVVTPKFSAGPLTTTTATKLPYTASKGPSATMKFTGAKFTLVAGGNSWVNDRTYIFGNRFYFLPQAGGIVDLNTPVVATSSTYTLTLPEPYLPVNAIGGGHPTVVFTATLVEMN